MSNLMATTFGFTLHNFNTHIHISFCNFESSKWRWRISPQTPSSLPVRVRVAASSDPNSPGPTSPLQNDLTYVLKLAGGSILGAALIKYGSASFPDITRPNLTLALLMISTPVVAALLLFLGSRKE